jgi:hypothetical protein
MLGTTLLGLADIMLLLGLELGFTITGKTSDGSTNGTANSVGDTRAQVAELTLSLLTLALGILLSTFALE